MNDLHVWENKRSSNEHRRLVWIGVIFFSLAGCKCSEPAVDPAAVQRKLEEAQRAADLAALPQAGGSLVDQLAAEKAARKPEARSLEKLTEVISAMGIQVGAPRQVLGNKQLALYCAVADTSDGLTVSVCEYPSEGQAQRGKAEADVIQNQMSGHQSRVKGESVLHVVARSDTPAATIDKVLAAFDNL